MFENPDISDMKSAEDSVIRTDDSTNESDYRKVRARQVGRLMLSYRLERKGRGRGGRLSQNGLLHLMGSVKGGYEGYSHSTVGRWESGEILPTKERLEVFGAALDLARVEIDGLIALAGLGDGGGNCAEVAATGSRKVPATAPEASTKADNPSSHEAEGRSYSGEVIRFLLSKFLLPGLGRNSRGRLSFGVSWMERRLDAEHVHSRSGLRSACALLPPSAPRNGAPAIFCSYLYLCCSARPCCRPL